MIRFSRFYLNEFVIDMPTPKETQGILRSKMPQIATKDYEAYMAYMRKVGINAKKTKLKVSKLKALQKQFSTDGIIRSMSKGSEKNSKPILVSRDGFVVDGNHRWLAARNTKQTDIDALQFDATKDEVMAATLAFPKVTFKKHGQS